MIFLRYWKNIRQSCRLAAFGGAAYGLIEILWRGRTHWSMLLTGGFCFALLHRLYQRHLSLRLFKRCLLGSLVITSCEFVCGMLVNRRLKLGVWDYSNRRFNIKGQICPLYSALWALLCLPVSALSDAIARRSDKRKQAEGESEETLSA